MLNPQNLKNGEEQYEKFYSSILRKHKVQYDYRHNNGELFSCIKSNLKECRVAKEKWVEKQSEFEIIKSEDVLSTIII